jgi:hypothetical protein
MIHPDLTEKEIERFRQMQAAGRRALEKNGVVEIHPRALEIARALPRNLPPREFVSRIVAELDKRQTPKPRQQNTPRRNRIILPKDRWPYGGRRGSSK